MIIFPKYIMEFIYFHKFISFVRLVTTNTVSGVSSSVLGCRDFPFSTTNAV